MNIKDKFWSLIGFIKFGFVKCGICGINTRFLWKPGDPIYDTKTDNWAYFCPDCPDVIFSDECFKGHPWSFQVKK